MLQITDKAPDFILPDENGQIHSLSENRGSWIFLYFYPKDNTAGCTTEACSVRDNFSKITELGVKIFGVSVDSVKSHQKFKKKYQLNFTLLSDEGKTVVSDYQVWGEKKFMGKEYMGVNRTSFLIDPTGKIAKVYEKVNPESHVEQVLTDLKTLT